MSKTQYRTVYKAMGGKSSGPAIHLDPECPGLAAASRLVERSEAVFPAWYDRCSICWTDTDA